MFYRFISENIENYVNTNQELAGINGFEYKYITDEEANYGRSQILEEKGLLIGTGSACNSKAKVNRVLQGIVPNEYLSGAIRISFGDDIKGLDNKSYSDKNTKFIYLDTQDIR
jgi:type I restriction enzyme M protein